MSEDSTGQFSTLDYGVFGALMTASAVIGLYFGVWASKAEPETLERATDTTQLGQDEREKRGVRTLLLGGRNLGQLPVTMSMIASAISGVTLLGVPTEIYTYGTQYALNALTDVLVCTTAALLFVPVYYELQVGSVYEYLELRYDKTLRYLLAAMYCIQSNFYTPLVMYVPALSLSQVTGINLHLISAVSCAVCVFYTALGGFRAVLWTDTLQVVSMGVGVVVVVTLGVLQAGGLEEVFRIAAQGDRLELFNMNPDPFILHSFWSVVVGGYLGWLGGMASSQPTLQRCLALPTLRQAQRATIVTSFGSAAFVTFSVFTGLAIYARYHDCDPIITQTVSKSDQILPYFVADIGAAIPGITGLFVAGIFSAALSSLSTVLNSVSGVLLHDLLPPLLGRPLSRREARYALTATVVSLGALCTALVFVVDKLGTLFQLSRTLGGMTGGARLGLFLFAFLVPWVKAKAVLYGGIATSLLTMVRVMGTQRALTSGDLAFPKRPVSVEACPQFQEALSNASLAYDFEARYAKNSEVLWLFRYSYLYNSLISLLLMALCTALASAVTGLNDPRDMDCRLFSPVIRRLLKLTPPPDPATSQEPQQENTNNMVEIELQQTT